MITNKRIARENALKYFYAYEFDSILNPIDFLTYFELSGKGKKLFLELTKNSLKEEFSTITKNLKNWKISRLNLIDKIIIALALRESHIGTPKKVVINEYLEISKIFSTKESSSFINGLLDSLI